MHYCKKYVVCIIIPLYNALYKTFVRNSGDNLGHEVYKTASSGMLNIIKHNKITCVRVSEASRTFKIVIKNKNAAGMNM